MKKIDRYFVILAFIFSFIPIVHASEEIIFAYENKEVFPYFMGDTNEVLSQMPGTSVEVLQKVAKDLDLNIKFVRYPWKRCLSLLKKGKVHAVFDASFNLERSEFASYPTLDGSSKLNSQQRIARLSYVFYKNIENSFSWDGKKTTLLKDKKIGAVLGYSIVSDLKKLNLPVKEFKTGEKALSVLQLNQISAYADLKPKIDYLLLNKKKEFNKIEQVGPPLKVKDYYLIFSKVFHTKNQKLASEIWSKIEELRKNGEVKSLDKKYYSGHSKTVNLVTVEWPPYVSQNIQGGGFTTEIIRKAFSLKGYNLRITYMPWARGLKKLERNKVDGIFPAYDTKERRSKYFVSDKFAEGPLVFMKRKRENIKYKTLDDLVGLRIGVVRGYVNFHDFDNTTKFVKVEAKSDEQNIKKLIEGKVDLIIIDKLNSKYILNEKFKNVKTKFNYLNPPFAKKGLHIIFGNKERQKKLQVIFNEGLREIKKLGILKDHVK